MGEQSGYQVPLADADARDEVRLLSVHHMVKFSVLAMEDVSSPPLP